jgi:hypothetical protein
MTRDERLELIAKLQEQADKGRAEIASRLAEREADPCLEQDYLREDCQRSEQLVTKRDATDLVYKTIVRSAPEEEDFSGWERWLRGHLDNERAAIIEEVIEMVAVALAEERRTHRAEVAALRAELTKKKRSNNVE